MVRSTTTRSKNVHYCVSGAVECPMEDLQAPYFCDIVGTGSVPD